ncbi:GNAT family N-acetyltransferase [Calothrix sp. 336/3]|uniref:GNAT family N-acetyltransferase n=1 Tax=Calothrix sp. 336/3 TaxID=1337936 RepID=UPI0004E367F5|nr:GNAT family N-acetyltransferase [Calothrix sp. 336/3]AKG24042.1 acetyltransferase [Calothrix sp. 336/3]
MSISIHLEENPAKSDIDAIIRQVCQYNETFVNKDVLDYLAAFLRDEQGEIVGGVVGIIHWQWLFISHLWVKERLRGSGYGTQLIKKIEESAKQRGCYHVWVDTFSFQALSFYENLGYEIFGVLEDYPPGYKRFFLQKRHLSDVNTLNL